MTDPNVGFSIYISDRERERLEMERRKQVAKPAATSNPVLAPVVPISAATAPSLRSSDAVLSTSSEIEAVSSSDEAPAPSDEEIFAGRLEVPIVSVSNVNADDTPWKAKHLQDLAASNKSICENCDHCAGYETNVKKPGICATCSCELIHHLKSIDMDHNPSDSEEDTEEEEWEDDDDDDDFPGDDGMGPGESDEEDVEEDEEIDDIDGGEDSSSPS